jgi:hypothetical protein
MGVRRRKIERVTALKPGGFRGSAPTGEQKLLTIANALLTTRGCGRPPNRPQPMGIVKKSVNRFVRQVPGFFPALFPCLTEGKLAPKSSAIHRSP